MMHKRRAEDHGNDNRLLAAQDAERDIREFEKAETRDRREQTIHWRDGVGMCSVGCCDKPVTQMGHEKCNKHTYHYYYPTFVLGSRDYMGEKVFSKAA